MKLIYTLLFLVSALVGSAQNDTIYPTQKVYHVGDTIKMVFKSATGSMLLLSNGSCSPHLQSVTQTLKPTGWPQIFQPKQMDCGLPTIDVPNGIRTLYCQNYPGTYRLIFFVGNKAIETEGFRVE